MYRVVVIDAHLGPALAKYAINGMKIKSVAIVDDATAYSHDLANVCEQTAQSLGLKVVSHDAAKDKAVDFHAILTKIKGEKLDAIVYGGSDITDGRFARQAKQLGLHVKCRLRLTQASLAKRPSMRRETCGTV